MKFMVMNSAILVLLGTITGISGIPAWFGPSTGIEHRIAGGAIAKQNEFPYQVLLRIVKTNEVGMKFNATCGGVLISDRFVLTAAHCIQFTLGAEVYLGKTNRKVKEDGELVIRVSSRNFVYHSSFHNPPYANDIGVIQLPYSVQFTDAIKPISLPNESSYKDLVNRIGTISGFGKKSDYESSNELRYVQRKILPPSACGFPHSMRFNDTIHICVDGSKGKSACAGDSGGPLAIEEADGSKTVVGVTSFGSSSCEYGSPVIYTRITAYLKWIQKQTGIALAD